VTQSSSEQVLERSDLPADPQQAPDHPAAPQPSASAEAPKRVAPIDVLIPTLNERINLPHALSSVMGWTNRVFVLDCGSTDGTQEYAREMGATVVEHPWEGYARQKNWGLDNLPFESPWIFILDADEAVTPELREEMISLTSRPVREIEEDGFYINRILIFLGRKIRHCGYFPSWNLRLFKRGMARYEDRPVHEHMILKGKEGYLRGLLRHEDHRGLEHYLAKHNRYSTLEAQIIFHGEKQDEHTLKPRLFGNAVERRRFFKTRIYPLLPGRWLGRFIWMYFINLGFLDGRAGLQFCLLIASHELLVGLKLQELRLKAKQAEQEGKPMPVVPSTLNVPATVAPVASEKPSQAENKWDRIDPEERARREPSPWTFGQKVRRVLWMITSATLFRCSFHNWYGWRRLILRLFGAKIGERVRIRPSVKVEIPWNLEIGDDTAVGDYAILYCLGKVTIGQHVTISQYAHICAGTHDYRSRRFPLLRLPITIEDDAWIAADAFVGPGVTIGTRAVVGARATAVKDVPPEHVVAGCPARFIKMREWDD
jgi:acetyltransferase-like isoleucine patch superfamily enzyme/glycosyltransferase involved in cell wall biosynthesis